MHQNEEIIFPKSKKTDLAENHEKMMHEYESKNDRPVLGKKNFQKSAIRKKYRINKMKTCKNDQIHERV